MSDYELMARRSSEERADRDLARALRSLKAKAQREIYAALRRRDALDPKQQFIRHLNTKAPLFRLFALAGAMTRRAVGLVWR
jgi:hypothetical protein